MLLIDSILATFCKLYNTLSVKFSTFLFRMNINYTYFFTETLDFTTFLI